ncbi:MAG: hypothetical protein K0M69_15905 [Youngiibacter sp.]|nr:hypothetical protein [Youngiibacter sp.]
MRLALRHYEIIQGRPYETRIVIEGEDEAWIRAELEKERIAYGWPQEECKVAPVWQHE